MTTFALFLRVWQLDTAVSVPLSDEYIFVDTAIALWDKPDFPLLEPLDRVIAFVWVQPYMVLLSMETLGWGVFAARLPSVIGGTLTVIACYFLAKQLFDRRTAVVAALVLATFPPHIHISRMVLINVFDPFFGTLALAFLVRGIKKADSQSLAICGLMLGLTQYFHEAGRLLFPIAVSLWLLVSISGDSFTSKLRILMTRSFQIFVPFLLIALPLYVTLFALDYPLFSRLEQTSPRGERNAYVLEHTLPKNILPENYIERLGNVILQIFVKPDNSPDFYGGTQPMLLYVISPLFLIGIFSLFRPIRERSHQQLMLWLALAIFGVAMIRIGAWTIRFAPIFPAIAIIIALGIRHLHNLFPIPLKRRSLVAIPLFVVSVQIFYYFVPHLNYYNRQVRWQNDFADAFHRSVDLPLHTNINFIDEDGVWMPYIQVLMRLWKRTDLEVVHFPAEEFDLSTARTLEEDGLGQVFFVNPEDEHSVEILRQVLHLTGPEYSPYSDVPIDLQYALYYVTNP
ncbi:MAG: glycosyltransferase family 39 protein [Aggregatilineales bacterium]